MTENNKRVDWATFRKFVEEFSNESDRAAVILGAAKLDELLYQLVKARLIPDSGGRDELLDGDGPLGTYSSRISMAFRLGLITAEFCRALHLIRRIRNSFAHEIAGCTLETGAHADRVRELARPFLHLDFCVQFRKLLFTSEHREGPSTNFRVVLAIISANLERLILDIAPLESSGAQPLISAGMLEYKLDTAQENAEPENTKITTGVLTQDSE
ncbi:hypothetical protein [Microbulbifer aggregans]|uniref:hypothetical protein n=1 Tax=Microbulbifer aggregans TaxID=1769779 RepID=UPI001CFE7A45|nr:hypothetical protein [Microbulbifer aggregans]